MSYTIEQIKADIVSLVPYDFFIKHLLRSDNWYFENIMGIGKENIAQATDDFKDIISRSLGISYNNIALVGSAKIGCSLTPPSPHGDNKLFLSFCTDSRTRKESDLDVAIISNKLFSKYWDLFRCSYKSKYYFQYQDIGMGIFKGYINDRRLDEIDACRTEWNPLASVAKNRLYSDFYVKHEVNFRLYRSWEDLEQYHLRSIDIIKRSQM
jgi:hypothetical protein